MMQHPDGAPATILQADTSLEADGAGKVRQGAAVEVSVRYVCACSAKGNHIKDEKRDQRIPQQEESAAGPIQLAAESKEGQGMTPIERLNIETAEDSRRKKGGGRARKKNTNAVAGTNWLYARRTAKLSCPGRARVYKLHKQGT
jgi:hypothetical protein